MNRRGFLRSILGGLAAVVIRPDLLIEPSRVMISTYVPPALTVGELSAVLRRAFIPQLVVEVYRTTPTLSSMLASAGSVSGGGRISMPLRGSIYGG